ncbi:methyltransferase [Vreelandella malpeensis]|uniref:Methyltransferase n=1 Tax=Vreelandella malpeensis TaxID=1172368 RepID=A0ABS8DTG2_9GAMM|nr:methyltransferase [Halomonas malpeensis]MCB8889612.1 methyltransferase [Halomonas malpeensis]
MSAQLPACQLLERYHGNASELCFIAVPEDDWLVSRSAAMVSDNVALRTRWQSAERIAFSPFDEHIVLPEAPVVLFWPKAHQLGLWWLDWLCATLPDATPLEIVGEHQGGIKRVPKLLDERGLGWDKLDNARRCSLYATRTVKRAAPDPWTRFGVGELSLVSHPGVFGHGKVDEGTRLLLETLERELQGSPRRVLDMGCGDGIITAWLARRGFDVTAVDVSAFAVQACRRTLEANDLTARVVESNVYAGIDGERFDLIVSNPPFHQEREISFGPSARLIERACDHLTPRGQLVLVANAFLPYPDLLDRALGSFETLADNRRFKVYRAGR